LNPLHVADIILPTLLSKNSLRIEYHLCLLYGNLELLILSNLCYAKPGPCDSPFLTATKKMLCDPLDKAIQAVHIAVQGACSAKLILTVKVRLAEK
jgi:hypothetical protein